jgi:ubiquinone biosynthesis protein UbiJ
VAGAGDLAPPRRQHLSLHGDLRLLDALVAAFRVADVDEDEDDSTALGPGVTAHAQHGADRTLEHRPGDEAALVKVGPGTTRSLSGLKKL